MSSSQKVSEGGDGGKCKLFYLKKLNFKFLVVWPEHKAQSNDRILISKAEEMLKIFVPNDVDLLAIVHKVGILKQSSGGSTYFKALVNFSYDCTEGPLYCLTWWDDVRRGGKKVSL